MCAGLRLGCKDSSGSNDYFFAFIKKKKKNPGIIPLCCVSHTAMCKAEMVGHQDAGHNPVPMDRGSAGLVSRHPCSSKRPAGGSAVVKVDMGLNYSPQALLKITRSFRT